MPLGREGEVRLALSAGPIGRVDAGAARRRSFRAATLRTSSGELAGIIGADADGGCDGVGHLWMYATYALDEDCLDTSARWLAAEKEWAWAMMKSFVDARNAPRIAWLDRLGFEVRQDARPYGIGGHSFRTAHLCFGKA